MKTIQAPSITQLHGKYAVTRPARGNKPANTVFYADIAEAKKAAGKIGVIAKITP